MAFGDNTFGANHRWAFNNALTDSIGSLTLLNATTGFDASSITRDGTHTMFTNSRDDRVYSAGATDINTAAQTRFAIGGFFKASQIQGPPTNIFKFGGTTTNLAMLMWAGNNVQFQCVRSSGAYNTQIYSDVALTDDRVYHLLVKISGSGYSNEFTAFIDGIEQTNSSPADQVFGATTMPAVTTELSWGEAGANGTDLSGTLVKGVINGYYKEWWSWNDADAESLSQADIYEIVGAGSVPALTITSGTEAAMQLQIDAIADTLGPDIAVDLLIEAVTGDGTLNLTCDNRVFNERCSMHLRYEGTGTLNWTNTNGANASTFTGDVNIINPTTLTIAGVISGAEIRIYDDDGSGGSLGAELTGIESNVGTTFTYDHSGAANDVAIQMLATGFEETLLFRSLTSAPQTFTLTPTLEDN